MSFSWLNSSGNINLISSGVQYALFIVFTCFTYLFIDKTGRRPLLVYGAIGMGVCHYVIGALLGGFGTLHPEGVDGNANVTIKVTGSPAYAVIAFCYLLIIVYALTLAPVAWVYAAEVWSLETRGTGMGIAATGNWMFNFALGLFIPPAFKNINWKAFMVFGTLCMGAAVQFYVSYPETGRKSLEEIEEMFRDGGPWPWKTKLGRSIVDERAAVFEAEQRKASMENDGKMPVVRQDGRIDHIEKNES